MTLTAYMDIERDGEEITVEITGELRRGISHDIEAPRDGDDVVNIEANLDGVDVKLTDTELERAEERLLNIAQE